MISALLGLLLSTGALATTPVLHMGEDPRILLAKSAAATKRPAENFKVLTIPEMVRGKPAVMLGGGRVASCYGPPTSDLNVREAVDRIERALAYLEYDKAIAHIQVGEEAIRCLSSPADAQRISRLYFLKGFVSFESGEKDVARAAFDAALTVDPELAWDEYFAPDAQPLFDETNESISSRERQDIVLLPTPADGVAWVDGRRVAVHDGTITLTEGRHLVQVTGQQLRSYWVTIRPFETDLDDAPDSVEDATLATDGPTLIIPTALTPDSVAWSSDPAERVDFDRILGVLYDPDSMVYFSVDGQLIAHPVGTTTWDELKIPPGFIAGGIAGRLIAGRSLMWTGAVVGGGGLILATSSWVQATSANRNAETAGGWMNYNSEQAKYESAGDRMTIARWTLLGGALIGGGGLALQFDQFPFGGGKAQASLVPVIGPERAGAAFVVDAW